MIKLALLGRGISHSKSELMYRRILKSNFSYTLLDCLTEGEIPSLALIMDQYYGLSITAPYKKHFLGHVELDEVTARIGAINCIKKSNGKYYGHNTDYLAIEEIIQRNDYLNKEIIILGDGAMANVLKIILEKYKKQAQWYSRKIDGPIENLNLAKKCSNDCLIINCCAREFVFKGSVPVSSVFWDLNYAHTGNRESLQDRSEYIDGEELLYTQALHAVKIWGLE